MQGKLVGLSEAIRKVVPPMLPREENPTTTMEKMTERIKAVR
jgi:hypothetical protein